MHFLNLKKYYFIDDFNPNHLKDLDKNITLIWRRKDKEENLEKIKELAYFCKKNKLQLLLSNNFKLALKLKLSGVYISAGNRSLMFNRFKFRKNFKIVGAAHNQIELNIKKLQNASEIFISPIFKYKNKKALGIHKVMNLFKNKDIKLIALGGVNKKNIKILRLKKFYGYAAIEMFQKKRPQ